MKFSEKLQILRKEMGFSQEILAEKLFVSRQSISEWEQGVSLPEVDKVVLIAEVFGVSIDDLLKDSIELKKGTTSKIVVVYEKDDIINKNDSIVEMVYCSRCGRGNVKNSNFCGYCGYAFEQEVVQRKEIEEEEFKKEYYMANFKMRLESLMIQKNQNLLERKNLKVQEKQVRLQKNLLDSQKKEYKSMAKCPKCGSTSLSGNKKGYGIGKGVIGAYIVGPIGLVAGNIGAKKVIVTCLKCGHRFKM